MYNFDKLNTMFNYITTSEKKKKKKKKLYCMNKVNWKSNGKITSR